MPRFVRVILTTLSFALFFGVSMLIGLVLFPVLFLLGVGDLEGHRRRCTWLIGCGYGTFLLHMRILGLVSHRRIEFPEELKGKPYVLIANHPTFIDLIFLLHHFPGLTCVVKASWYRDRFAFGPLLRSTNYIPGPGHSGPDGAPEPAGRAVDRMVDHVSKGHPLLIFPEGTRSAERHLRRFKRGAFEVAKRTGVPLVPVVIRVDHPFLMKGIPFWKVPEGMARFEFDVLPTVDVASDERTSRKLCRETEGEFERRFSDWVDERERMGLLPAVAEAEVSS